jgi:hypothetical protein
VTITAVAYSGGPSGVINADDEFLAINIESPPNYSNLEGAYINEDEVSDQDVPIESVTESVVLLNPDASGNANDGNYLVVWEADNPGDPRQSDIYAQLMGNMYTDSFIFLPLILR